MGYFWVTSQLPSGWVTSGYFWIALQSTIYNLQSTIYNVIPRAVDGKFGAPRRGWSIPWLVRGCFAYTIDSVVGPLEHMADCDHGPDAHFGLKLSVPKKFRALRALLQVLTRPAGARPRAKFGEAAGPPRLSTTSADLVCYLLGS